MLPWFVNTDLTYGTRRIRGLAHAQPQQVADAIVALIARPKPKIRVPRITGALIVAHKHAPRRLA